MLARPQADTLRADVEVADDLFGYGSFDRETTAARRTFPVGWLVPRSHERWDLVDGPGGAVGDLALQLASAPDINTTVRIAALVDVPRHRLYGSDGIAVDGDPTYEIRMVARRDHGQTPFVRLATYTRHDTDPTVGPRTEPLEELELPLDIPKDGDWHEVTIEIPDALVQYDGDGALALNLTLVVPSAHLGTLAVDNLELLKWRGRADADVALWMPASRVRSIGGATDIDVRSC